MNDLKQQIQDLSDADPAVRSQAAIALGQAVDEQAVQPLIERLFIEPALEVREDVTWAIVKFGEAAISPLVDYLSDDSAAVRHLAVHALGKIGHVSALSHLAAMLADLDTHVRVKAIVAMGQVGAAPMATAIIGMFADQEDTVRNTAMDVLTPLAATIEADLLHALTHTEALVREHSAVLLGGAKSQQAVEALCTLCDDEDVDVRLAAIQALGEIGSDPARECLRVVANTATGRARQLATGMLKRIES
ncbi:MAG: HEAT repeat domain-containing protein [Chloroflexota bacterium]